MNQKCHFCGNKNFRKEEDVVQPDILYISKENRGKIAKEGVRGVPDLVAEILSPATEQRDRVIKRKLYGRYGVKELWIVDPEGKTVELVGWEGSGPQGSDFKTIKTYPTNSTFASPLIDGLSFPVASIFEE